METCEQANASQAAFDNLLKRIPGLPEAVEAVDHNQPPPQPGPLELAAGLGRFAIVRETTKLTKPLRPTTEPSSRLRTSHQDVIDLAIAADMTDIERLALLLSCRGEGPVADQFKREHEDWTEFDKALQPGVAIGLLGHNLGRNQPDYFYRVGQPGGLRVISLCQTCHPESPSQHHPGQRSENRAQSHTAVSPSPISKSRPSG